MRNILLSCYLFVHCVFLLGQSQRGARPTNDTPIPASYFGMHIHGTVLPRANIGRATEWPTIPFSSWRLWDSGVTWSILEPRKGEWHFDTLDQYVAMAQHHHIQVLLTLGMPPAWASSRPKQNGPYGLGSSAPPEDIADWQTYIRTVATRYKGKIHEYEIWNEPTLNPSPTAFFSGTVDDMVSLVREARTVLKEVDPTIVVVSPPSVGYAGIPWLEQFFVRGGGRYVDVIGFHFYVMDIMPHQNPELMLSFIRQVQDKTRAAGLGQLPIWNTESGWKIDGCVPVGRDATLVHHAGTLSTADAAAYLARAYILAWSAGVKRFYYYSWDHLSMGLIDCDGKTLKPPANAYQQVEKWLLGAQMKSCAPDSAGSWTCELARNGKQQFLLWNQNRRLTYVIPTTWDVHTATDLTGRPTKVSAHKVEIGSYPLLLQ